MTKTAVDFYDQKLHILDLDLKSGSITIGEYFTLKSELLTQAKQMEKKQIQEAHKEGQHYANHFEVPHQTQAEQYYESKYGKDENKAENND